MVDSASRTPKFLRGIAPPDNKSFNLISLQKTSSVYMKDIVTARNGDMVDVFPAIFTAN